MSWTFSARPASNPGRSLTRADADDSLLCSRSSVISRACRSPDQGRFRTASNRAVGRPLLEGALAALRRQRRQGPLPFRARDVALQVIYRAGAVAVAAAQLRPRGGRCHALNRQLEPFDAAVPSREIQPVRRRLQFFENI